MCTPFSQYIQHPFSANGRNTVWNTFIVGLHLYINIYLLWITIVIRCVDCIRCLLVCFIVIIFCLAFPHFDCNVWGKVQFEDSYLAMFQFSIVFLPFYPSLLSAFSNGLAFPYIYFHNVAIFLDKSPKNRFNRISDFLHVCYKKNA